MCDLWLPNQLLVCAPVGGAWSVGGQKCRWNDLVQRDLVRCGIQEDWRKLSQDISAWQGVVVMCIDSINKEAEKRVKMRRKMRGRETTKHILLYTTSAGLVCDHPNCIFNQAGLINHKHQKHALQNIAQCVYCRKSFDIQGLPNHKQFCAKRH